METRTLNQWPTKQPQLPLRLLLVLSSVAVEAIAGLTKHTSSSIPLCPVPIAAQLLRVFPLDEGKWNLLPAIVEFDGEKTTEISHQTSVHSGASAISFFLWVERTLLSHFSSGVASLKRRHQPENWGISETLPQTFDLELIESTHRCGAKEVPDGRAHAAGGCSEGDLDGWVVAGKVVASG